MIMNKLTKNDKKQLCGMAAFIHKMKEMIWDYEEEIYFFERKYADKEFDKMPMRKYLLLLIKTETGRMQLDEMIKDFDKLTKPYRVKGGEEDG